jgi:hypothetical protein
MLLLERRKEGRGQVQKGEEILHSLAMQQQQQKQQPTSDPARQARDGVAKKKRKTFPARRITSRKNRMGRNICAAALYCRFYWRNKT